MVCGQFQDCIIMGGRAMTDQEEQSSKETVRKEKRIKEETEGLASEQERKRAYLAKEQANEEAQKAKKTERMEKQAADDIKQSAKDQARREAFFAHEQANAEAQKERRLKANKEPHE